MVLPAAIVSYVRSMMVEGEVERKVREECEREGLPSVPPETARVLTLLSSALKVRRALEIGCLLGYSGISILRGMEEGVLETIEREREFARRARRNFERAGLSNRAQILEGEALEILPTLPSSSYDLVFIDADKENYPTYLQHSLDLVREGGAIVADNILWGGRVLDPKVQDPQTQGVREYARRASMHPDLLTLLLPIGDGVAVSLRQGSKRRARPPEDSP